MIGWTWEQAEPRTLREIVWAAQGREYAEWERLAFLVAHVMNCHVDTKKQRPFKPFDIWHRPGAKRPGKSALTVDALHGMRPMFTRNAG